MLVLTLRTDKPEAELGLYTDDKQIDYESWQAHRELSETIHKKLDELLTRQGKSLQDVGGIVGFQGPGSFTGLRIGLTVANTLAYGLGIPALTSAGDDWQKTGIQRLKAGEADKVLLPEYGSSPHITKPKK